MNKDVERSIIEVENIILSHGEEAGVWYYISRKGIRLDVLVQNNGKFTNRNNEPVSVKRKRAGDLLTLLLEMADIDKAQGTLF